MAVRQHEIPGHWICLLSKRKKTFMGCIFLFLSRFNGGKNRQTRRVHCPRRPAGASKQLVDNKSTFQKYAQTRNPKLIKMNKIKEKKKKLNSIPRFSFMFFFRHLLLLILEFCLFRFVRDVTRQRPQNAMPPTDQRLVPISVKELAGGKSRNISTSHKWN